MPNTFLLVIPLGRREITQPLNRISNVGYHTGFEFIRFLIGILALLAGVAFFGNNIFWGLVLLIVAVLAFSWSYVATITVTDNSGKENEIPVSLLDRDEVNRFLDVINVNVAQMDDKKSPPAQKHPEPDRVEKLHRLSELRDSGALTDDEFQAEKRKIIDT